MPCGYVTQDYAAAGVLSNSTSFRETRHRLRPRAERAMQEKFTDKHPARAYFESLSQLDQIQAMQIVAEFEESEMRQRRRYAALMEQRKEEV